MLAIENVCLACVFMCLSLQYTIPEHVAVDLIKRGMI